MRLGVLKGSPYGLGSARHINMLNSEVCNSVAYRVMNSWSGADCAGLTNSFSAQGVPWASGFGVGNFKARKFRS